jgi:serine/threonine-protein kinase
MSTDPGSAIEGKYEVLGKVREGGMGAIYMVRHRLLDEIRIIKVMRPEVAESAEQRKRFLREAQMATRLKHTNIVSFYDFFVDEEGTAYMVMEYIDGINVRDMIRNCGALPVSLGLYLSRQCLSALDYLHRKGIIHRDIAPDNIMMTQEEDGTLQAKLIDLGIAKLQRSEEQEQLTAGDEFIGKLRYASPEQLTRKASSAAIDGRSDLFSFGVVLYEALTGICPYGGGSLQDILTARLHKPPMPFTQSDPQSRLGAVLRGTILQALQTKPEDRYANAPDFSRAIEALPASEANPETPDQVNQYVRRAIEAARKAAAAANPGVSSSVQRTLQSKFRVSEISIRPLEATDLHVQKTIARMGADTTPQPTRTATSGQMRGDEKTMAYAGPRGTRGAPSGSGAGALPEPRRSPMMGYVLAAVGAAALVVIGIVVATFVSSRSRGSDVAPIMPRPTSVAATPALAESPSAPTSIPVVNVQPTAAPVLPTTAPIAEARPTAAARPTRREDRARPDKREPTVKVAQIVPPVSVPGSKGPRMHFCAEIGRTAYIPGVSKEVPPGFKESAPIALREDAALINIRISILPEEPLEGQEFTIVARFVNGGDQTFRLSRVEESSPAVRGGFQPIAGVPLNPIDAGGSLEIYRKPRVMSAGETYRKAFRVVETRRGDAWENSIFVKSCQEQ